MKNAKKATIKFLRNEETPKKGAFGCRVFKEDGNGPNKVPLYAPHSFYKAHDNLILEHTGKCGPGDGIGDKLVPETLWGLRVTRACRIHDWMYSRMCTTTQKTADRIFLNNMRRLVIHGSKIKWLVNLRLTRAKTYYLAVKYGGKSAVTEKE